MRVLVTGSRTWEDAAAIYDALHEAAIGSGKPIHEVTVVHGGAAGVDVMAEFWAKEVTARTEVHYVISADWQEHGKSAGYLRNKRMVDLGADVCLAFIRNGSKGATMTADLAEKAGIPTHRFVVDE